MGTRAISIINLASCAGSRRASALLPLLVSRRLTLRPSAFDRCQTEESASNGGNLPGPPSEGFHSPESVQHPAFYRYQESYPRRNGSPRNCCSRVGDERNAVPVSV